MKDIGNVRRMLGVNTENLKWPKREFKKKLKFKILGQICKPEKIGPKSRNNGHLKTWSNPN